VVEDCTEIAKDLGSTPSDVQDALQYWLMNGIIQTEEATAKPAVSVTEPNKEPVTPSTKISVDTKPQKPNRAEVARRGAESPEISWLLCEAQNKFNRTLTFSDSSTLVWLMDTYGLSPAVIVMIIEYAASQNKCNIRFIEKTALSWLKNDINTVEKAEVHLTRLEQARNNWNTVRRVFGIEQRKPTSQEEVYTARWLEEWKFSQKMLKEAYDRCINSTGKISFPYINKILEKWHQAGFRSPKDIVEDAPDTKKATASGLKRTSNEDSSYDINEIERLLLL
jgi:DnaD/phage-associated family protein